MAKRQASGVIEETLPKGLFRIRLDDGTTLRAGTTAAARRISVKFIPGDRVQVEVSSYDPSRGRITASE